MKRLSLLPLVLLLSQCASPRPAGTDTSVPSVSRSGMPQIINVSAYDPKERQRDGRSYSVNDVSALCNNGAVGLIARAGKGGNLDEKCAAFLASADRVGMLPGVYYRQQKHVDAVKQADQFVARAHSLARSRSWNAPALLLCADFDGNLSLSDIVRFMERVEARTGVVPVAYLENSAQLKHTLSTADSRTKEKLRRMPYWLALYSHDNGAEGPADLVRQYDVWRGWTLWQYGGVEWQRGRSRSKVYHHGRHRFSTYFGNLDRPVERNVFYGSHGDLQVFWQSHGLPLR